MRVACNALRTEGDACQPAEFESTFEIPLRYCLAPAAEGCEGAGMRTMNHRRGLALERRYSHKELQSIRRTGKMTVYQNKYHEDSI